LPASGYFQFVGVARGASLTVELVVGLSLIDVATAQRNALSEIPPTQTFDDTRANAAAAWRDALQRVDVTAPTSERTKGARAHTRTRTLTAQLRIALRWRRTAANAALWTRRLRTFYTGLYHAHSAPTNYTEWPTSGGGGGGGGTYRGMDGDVHRAARGATYFSDMSIWDIHRTQTPLLALLRRDIASDVVRSLLAMYSDGGALPRWPLATVYTGCMVGSHANVIIADAWFRGVPLDNATLAVEVRRPPRRSPRAAATRVTASARPRGARCAIRRCRTRRGVRRCSPPGSNKVVARQTPPACCQTIAAATGFLPDNLQDRSGAGSCVCERVASVSERADPLPSQLVSIGRTTTASRPSFSPRSALPVRRRARASE
jgi:hypothetical protein